MQKTEGNQIQRLQLLAPDVQVKQAHYPQESMTVTTTSDANNMIDKQSYPNLTTQSPNQKIRRLSKVSMNGHSQSSSEDQQQWNKQKSQDAAEPPSDMINVLNMISQSQPIDKKALKPDSLAHDIKLGWVPKTQVTGPIPLSFSHKFIDSVIETKLNQCKLLYLGPRPTNSFQIHQQYYKQGKSYPFYQFHLCKSQFLDRFFKKYYPDYNFDNINRGQLIQTAKLNINQNDQLTFQSDYEGGNLDAVYFEDQEYRLLVRVDSNTRGHCNYYNFKVKSTNQATYRFRIMNLSKRKLLYERGMKPYIKVLNKKASQQTPWSQCGTAECLGVRFCPSPLNDIATEEYKQFYSLKFQLQLNPLYEYQLCYCVPYTYSELWHFVNSIRDNGHVYVSKLGYSLSGVEVPMLTVADSSNRQHAQAKDNQDEEESNLFYVVITGRIHPAESNSSHIVNGLIKFLLKALPETENIQKHIVFKIIPMLNPDGVIIGNTRTGFAGKDLNRKFSIKTQFIFPEVNNLRDYVLKMKQKYGKKLLFVIDVHGHSTRRGSFFFGPQYSVLDEQYTKCRLLPKMFSIRSEVFRYYSCKFKISQGKQATSRGFFNTNGVRTYTHETSVHSFYDFATRKDLTFTKKSLQLLGQDLALAIFDYVQKVHLFTTVKQIAEINPNKPPKKHSHPPMPIQPLPSDQQHESDKMPSDKADSQSQTDDIQDKKLIVFYQRINENRQYFYDEIVKMLKNKKQTLTCSSNTMKKEKKMKLNQIQKHKKKEEKDVRIFQRRKSIGNNQAGNKVNYTPKKTLFQEYSKSPFNIQKSPTQKTPIKISSKFHINKNQFPNHLRSTSERLEDFLFGFQRVKLQSNTNRIIYSVPSIKWDYDSQTASSRFGERNQIYRYDNNEYPKTDLRQKKQKIMHGKFMQSVFAEPQRKEPQKKQLKINRQLLEKLLLPAANMVVNEPGRNELKVSHVKEVKRKFKSSTGGQHFPNTDFRVFAAFSEINKSQELRPAEEKVDKVRYQSQVGPQVETKKEEYLCKKWEKEILFRTKRAHSFGGRIQMGQTQFGAFQSPFVKTFSKQYTKSPKMQELQKPSYPQTQLPKIFLNKKDALVIN